jgi:hypothetical protein
LPAAVADEDAVHVVLGQVMVMLAVEVLLLEFESLVAETVAVLVRVVPQFVPAVVGATT